jgi:hypothetical protein
VTRSSAAVLPNADMAVSVQTSKLCVRMDTLQVKTCVFFSIVPYITLVLSFLAILVHFLVLSHQFSSSFVLLCIFLSIPGIMLYLLYSFQFSLTVRILGFVWNILLR